MTLKDIYAPTEYNQKFDCSDGDHSMQIQKVEETTAKKTGNFMLVVTYKVDNIGIPYTENYVFTQEHADIFNSNITRLMDAFGIQRGDCNYSHWENKTGIGHFMHKEEEFTDNTGTLRNVNRCRLQYLLVSDSGSSGPVDSGEYTFTKEQAAEMKEMTSSAVFAADEVQAFRDELAAHKVTASDLLWKVRNQYTARLKNSTAAKKPVQEDIW